MGWIVFFISSKRLGLCLLFGVGLGGTRASLGLSCRPKVTTTQLFLIPDWVLRTNFIVFAVDSLGACGRGEFMAFRAQAGPPWVATLLRRAGVGPWPMGRVSLRLFKQSRCGM